MRIAIHAVSEPGVRAARILLAERDLAELGMHRRVLTQPDDDRARRIEDVTGFDVHVSDEVDDPAAEARIALEAGVSCVLWSDMWEDRDTAIELGKEFAEAGLTLVVGAALGAGIAAALASHELARTDAPLEVTIGWTVPGRPLRRGEALPFPDPVGSRWGRPADDPDMTSAVRTRRFVAPIGGDWSGAVARVTGVLDDGVARRVVGVADHTAHLEGIAIAAAAVAAAAGAYPPGLRWPADADEYLERALDAGLAVATFTDAESTRERRPKG